MIPEVKTLRTEIQLFNKIVNHLTDEVAKFRRNVEDTLYHGTIP